MKDNSGVNLSYILHGLPLGTPVRLRASMAGYQSQEELRDEKGIACVVEHTGRDIVENRAVAGIQHSDFNGHDLFR